MVINKKDSFTYKRKLVDIDSPLGTLTLRYISLADSKIFLKYFDDSLDSKNIAKKFIINQLTPSDIIEKDLDKLTDDELLYILKEYLTKEGLNEYFDLDTINNLSDFDESLYEFINYYYKENSAVIQNIENHMDDLAPVFEELTNLVPQLPINHLINTSNVLSNQAIDVMRTFNKNGVYRDLDIIFENAQDLIEIIQPQVIRWSNLINNNLNLEAIQNKINDTLDSLNKHYDIPMKQALNCLNKYSWFISPNMGYDVIFEVLEICEDDVPHKKSRINNLFVDYFLEDDCRELTNLIKIWDDNPLFKRRSKIFRDCVNVIKNANSTLNYSNLVVPVLITQIDGIQRDFMEKNNLKIERGKVTFLDDSKYLDGKVKWDEYFRDLTNGDDILDAMNDIFLNVLFQKTMPGEDYKTSIHFSRHKILHGENFRYGRKDYTMRCFMILDFLYEISLEN